MEAHETGWRAVVLAGERPGGDPLARRFGVDRKALLAIAGRAMVEHVVAALRKTEALRSVAVCGLDPDQVAALPALAGVGTSPPAATPSASVLAALEPPEDLPLLVTTADHPLLRAETVRDFLAAALASGADVAVGVVDAAVVRRRFPESRRTYVRFRSRALTGANLFAFLTPRARIAAEAWREVERDRKRPWRMVRRLGLTTLLRFLLRRLSLDDAVERVSRELCVRIAIVWIEDAAAAVDVDRAEDLALATKLLDERTHRSTAG
jgi:molybdopterin-guanine dinucleotide biosynthesis protein A